MILCIYIYFYTLNSRKRNQRWFTISLNYILTITSNSYTEKQIWFWSEHNRTDIHQSCSPHIIMSFKAGEHGNTFITNASVAAWEGSTMNHVHNVTVFWDVKSNMLSEAVFENWDKLTKSFLKTILFQHKIIQSVSYIWWKICNFIFLQTHTKEKKKWKLLR